MSTIKPGDVMLTKSCRMVRVLASRDDGAVAMRDYRSRVAVRSVDTDRLSYHSEHELTLVQPPATPQEPEQAQTLNDVFDVFETWARRKGATDTSSVSLGFWAFNEFHAIIGQPLRDWLLSRRASTPSPEGQTWQLSADDVEWVVNDNAELGVKIGNQFFFCYKGHSLVYAEGTHDDGRPMMWRRVFKREFGECIHPVNYLQPTHIGTVSLDDSDEWMPLPSPPTPEGTEP